MLLSLLWDKDSSSLRCLAAYLLSKVRTIPKCNGKPSNSNSNSSSTNLARRLRLIRSNNNNQEVLARYSSNSVSRPSKPQLSSFRWAWRRYSSPRVLHLRLRASQTRSSHSRKYSQVPRCRTALQWLLSNKLPYSNSNSSNCSARKWDNSSSSNKFLSILDHSRVHNQPNQLSQLKPSSKPLILVLMARLRLLKTDSNSEHVFKRRSHSLSTTL